MSTQSPYLNAIILFPLITQVIGSSIAYVVFELDYYREGYFDSALFGFFLTFWLFTVPTIIISYLTKRCGYLRYQWKKILFLSFIIVFCYWCTQPLNMRNIKTNRDWAGIFGNKRDEYR